MTGGARLQGVKRLVRGVITALLLLVVVSITLYAVPPLVLRDAGAPDAIAPLVDDARRSVTGNSRRFPLPLHPRFIGARCFHGGIIELSFEEWVPPYLDMRYAVAVGELDPPHGVHGWGGGYHLESIGSASMIEEELAPQLGDEVACE